MAARRTAAFSGPLANLWPDLTATLSAHLLPPAQALPPVTPAAWVADPALQALLDRAAADLLRPWPPTAAHAWARFRRDGNRTEYEATCFARTARLTRAVVAAAWQPTPERLDEVADGAILLTEQSSWCWPAHDDAWHTSGAVLPDVDRPFLDLGAGEVAAQLAWLWHALGQPLEDRFPGLGQRLRHEVDHRVLTPFLTRRDWHWLGLSGQVHNWSPWIHGHVLAAALRLETEPARRAQLVELCVEGLDRYLAALPPDGSVDEGYAYWWQGAGRLLEALDLLRYATGGHLDAFALPAVRATVAFPHTMALGMAGWYVNFADCSARPGGEQPWPSLYRLARLVGNDAAAAHALAGRAPADLAPGGAVPTTTQPADGLGRLLLALSDLDWRAAPPTQPPLPLQAYLPGHQLFVARQRAGSAAGLAVAAKGGHNGENHNHCDVGQVIVALDGVPVVADAGRTTYTAATFGPDRYQCWAMQSAWHNVPLVGGYGQGVGPQFAAAGAAAQLEAGLAEFSLDLAGAYGAGLSYLRRVIRLERTAGPAGQVVITDEWPSDAPPEVESRFLLAGCIKGHGPGWLVVESLAGAGLRLTWPAGLAYQVVEQPLDDPCLTSVWGPALHQLRLPAGQAGTCRVVLQAVSETTSAA
ncbi:MAG: heparinase II/III-family protein [Bifidobacteriaceae bacterium]|jgi:hypothetical protein|nr:heparinase II/III-family protein [Bifidobacteriaceae bacterium]